MPSGAPAGLVGRDRQWALLAETVDRAVRGNGGVVLLAGEPGIGKTRLLAETLDLARRSGAATALTTCVASGRPYRPWRQLLRRYGASAAFDVERHDDGGRDDLFEVVEDLLDAAAADGGLVVGIDDLQWADPASLRLLASVGRSAPLRPLLVVGAFRDAEVTEVGRRRHRRRARGLGRGDAGGARLPDGRTRRRRPGSRGRPLPTTGSKPRCWRRVPVAGAR